jgi:hypothetical protein
MDVNVNGELVIIAKVGISPMKPTLLEIITWLGWVGGVQSNKAKSSDVL